MLLKLLKHDLRATWKPIVSLDIASVVLAALGGLCLTFVSSGNAAGGGLLVISASLFAFASMFAIVGAAIISVIITYKRFYKNLYTDEGYLTFTLPASRTKIHLSKTIMALIWALSGSLTLIVSFSLYILIPFNSYELTLGVSEDIWTMIFPTNAWLIGYIPLILLLAVAASAFSVCLMQLCITISALLVKRAKIIVGIAVYYGITTALQFISQMILIVGGALLGEIFISYMTTLSVGGIHTLILSGLFIFFIIQAALAVGTFLLTQLIINKKLNLI